jgi:hypothetical protein
LNNIDPSNKTNEPKSAASELDELFGSIRVTSDTKPNIALSTQNELEDCLPLFPTTSTKPNNPSNFNCFPLNIIN